MYVTIGSQAQPGGRPEGQWHHSRGNPYGSLEPLDRNPSHSRASGLRQRRRKESEFSFGPRFEDFKGLFPVMSPVMDNLKGKLYDYDSHGNSI